MKIWRSFAPICLCLALFHLQLWAEADMVRLKSKGFSIPGTRTEAPAISVLPEKSIGTETTDRILLPAKEKVTLLNFWASWSPPSLTEWPSLQRLSAKLKDTEFQLAAINMNEETSTVSSFLRETGITIPVFYFPDGDALNAYILKGLPTSYLIDKAGRVAAVHAGGADWDDPCYYPDNNGTAGRVAP